MLKGSLAMMLASIALMFSMLYVAGVFDSPRKGPKVFEELKVKNDDWVHIYRDVETGCQYIRVRDGVTPRLTADGKVMCGLSK
ncbi:hypothetical protein AWB78_05926 [Caballeronia calidae]|uniref:DUF6440 domain-containing protein n=1 Tax=Caballeronia calidae TaxID=1777139 RepID=A0A158E097_9BURK|nr:DUF6440 family protein [Caballeronia calidae]SAL00299.1 hypothetical protein AWB78_05926 [Caballeronia calidae]